MAADENSSSVWAEEEALMSPTLGHETIINAVFLFWFSTLRGLINSTSVFSNRQPIFAQQQWMELCII